MISTNNYVSGLSPPLQYFGQCSPVFKFLEVTFVGTTKLTLTVLSFCYVSFMTNFIQIGLLYSSMGRIRALYRGIIMSGDLNTIDLIMR